MAVLSSAAYVAEKEFLVPKRHLITILKAFESIIAE